MDEGDFEEELEVLRELENGGGDMQATQQSDGDLFRSRPSRGGTSALFFEDDSGDEGDRGPAPHGAMDGLVSEGHRMRSDFQSSPPTFTSPSFRADQPMPIPSDWSIVNARKRPTHAREASPSGGSAASEPADAGTASRAGAPALVQSARSAPSFVHITSALDASRSRHHAALDLAESELDMPDFPRSQETGVSLEDAAKRLCGSSDSENVDADRPVKPMRLSLSFDDSQMPSQPVSLSQSLPTAANRESLIRASSVHDVDVSMTFVDNEADSQSARLLESNHDAEMGACSKRIRLGVGQHADAAGACHTAPLAGLDPQRPLRVADLDRGFGILHHTDPQASHDSAGLRSSTAEHSAGALFADDATGRSLTQRDAALSSRAASSRLHRHLLDPYMDDFDDLEAQFRAEAAEAQAEAEAAEYAQDPHAPVPLEPQQLGHNAGLPATVAPPVASSAIETAAVQIERPSDIVRHHVPSAAVRAARREAAEMARAAVSGMTTLPETAAALAAEALAAAATGAHLLGIDANPPASRGMALSKPSLAERDYRVQPTYSQGFKHGLVAAVSSLGTPVFFPKRPSLLSSNAVDAFDAAAAATKSAVERRSSGLLSIPIHRLMKEVEAKRLQDQMDREILAQRQRQLRKQALEESTSDDSAQAEKLWVDKYAPRMYVDLVGDERLNRQVLTWVKQWDYCVFKKPVKRTFEAFNQSRFRKKLLFEGAKVVLEAPPDPLHRPERRILLLAGPPGLGKTTLAHVVARHAGYNVVEINASDDRTGEALKNKLLGAIECQPVMGGKLPNLVIIDEIDGASSGGGDQAFVNTLVRLAESKESRSTQSEAPELTAGSVSQGDKKPKKKAKQLMRPIICICNDQFAPVLRALRSVAQVLVFRPPPFQALARRLFEICRWEGLRADMRAMMTLCEMTQGDMRSSMNTLQFMHGKTGHLTKEMLLDFDVGNKDFARSLFQVWQTLFSAPLSKDLKRLEFHVRGANSKSSLREVGTDRFVERIVPILEHTGEYSKILQGCFENYLKSHRVETMWSKAADSPRFNQTFNALHLCDAIERSIMRHQHFELMAYQPYAIVSFHRLYATPQPMELEFPRADHQAFVMQREAAGVMRTFAHGVVAHARMAWPSQLPMRLELVPFLLLALSPNFRPVNMQLIKPAERAELDRLVTLMLAFGLHFAPQKDAGHQQSYELDPPIHALLLQSKLERTINDASSAIKSLVAQEVDLARVRLRDTSSRRMSQPGTESSKTGGSRELIATEAPSSPLSQHAIKDDLPARDFFGRPIAAPERKEDQASSAPGLEDKGRRLRSKVRVVFKFNEGFSNAVRTPCYMRDFL
ncbi:Chromosome transmission fidelity protein 18 [Polyrhizophydium stewartii]|uniref:Chromosome transmission fidelity protein 18 n=1 Tax=Polyrhizophydium stewartii TaxID=2732419 RepID=A0ABR4NF15_9FUNG